ncbi:MAG: HD domain-containing protein [Campylobacterota bacterium]|nr:HD domain-containing protein [Campylobacterota bacterium]
MNNKIKLNSVNTFVFMLIVAIIGLLIVINILNSSKKEQKLQSQKLLVQEASSHYETIKNLEIWHNKFGGVFKNIEDENSYQFNIYSLKPKNTENQAKGYMKEAIKHFQNNPKETKYFRFTNNEKDFSFAGVLNTSKSCTQCHNDFKVGDVRGGIEVKIPLTEYRNSIKTINKQFNLFYILVGGFYFLVIIGLFYFIKSIFKYKEKIEELNSSLEKKVFDRTKEVQQLYSREHYLKNLLETISELNETLIESYSLGSIIETSLNTLHHHPNYKMIMFGFFDGKQYHKRYISGDNYELLTKDDYNLDELKDQPFLKSTYDAITQRKWCIDDTSAFNLPKYSTQRETDYSIYASCSFPMFETQNEYSYDVLTFFTSKEEGFDNEEISLLEGVNHDISMALSVYKQRKLTEKLQKEQLNNYEETILAFVDMIEQRDAYTAGHTLRVAKYSRMIAHAMQMEEELIQKIEKAAILHDIGKIATPDTILLKPGRLNQLEYKLIQNHVTAGYKMLSKVKMYSSLAEIMKFHHEHYDGTGYPHGYKKDEIPLEAHILIVADAFDAMTTNRIYKGKKTVTEAIEELEKNKGTQFHPRIVDVASDVLTKINILQTTQMPQNELEKQRFSYFFNDNLTELYNEAYLQLVLHQIESKKYINVIELKNFTQFNKEHNWHKGNELLISVANQLQISFPNSKLFRFEGDDFFIISDDEVKFTKNMLNLEQFDEKNTIDIISTYFVVENSQDTYKIEKFFKL